MSDDLDGLSLILATVPERELLRRQCVASIEAQTMRPAALLWEVDANHRGPVATFNSLASKVTTDWLFPFADDDLLDPEHFEVLQTGLSDNVDIVYTWCRVTGRPELPETLFQIERPFHHLKSQNWIPGSAAIRTQLWKQLGGWQDPGIMKHEDWHFWVRAYNAGARFLCIPTVTWTYRVDREWSHVSDGVVV